MRSAKIRFILPALFALLALASAARAETAETPAVTAESLADGKTVSLEKGAWKYKPGDDAAWAAKDFDDSVWETLTEAKITPKTMPASGWNGRGWFRLRFNVDDAAASKNLALVARQIGASEVYLDGKLLIAFGIIKETGETEYNPNGLPIPFRVERAGEHTLAVRYSASALADLSSGAGAWLAQSVRPGISPSIADAEDVGTIIQRYANESSARGGAFFIGVLSALALLHLLLFAFYRAERANLFYSVYAFAFALVLVCGNFMGFGHQGAFSIAIARVLSSSALAVMFVALLAFLHVAFRKPFGRIFWAITGLWLLAQTLFTIYLNNVGRLGYLSMAAIGTSFAFSIYVVVRAILEKRAGAWILMTGVQIFACAMLLLLLGQFGILDFSYNYSFVVETALLLGVPIAVSIFLARNFARTNRDLTRQLATVEQLSAQQIEQERREAEMRVEHERTRAENERRAKELEEARLLQLSLLPKKLPQLANLDVAAYMKPATEVGGDYYDFHVSSDGTLTIAIGDATGHGLKAGSVVTATKSLFNAFADSPDIPLIFGQTNKALKKMNLRGLFMAMAILKFKNNRLKISVAGMPPILIYRCASKQIEKVALRALPLGSVSNFEYQTEELTFAAGDVAVLMSDGFPEMFDPAGEMLGYDRAETVLRETCEQSAQTIVNRLIETGEQWANGRAQDDDVTFVVLKVK